MRNPSSIFSYYGGKSKLSGVYDPPRYDTIVEPFAGSAAYAARYYERDVILAEVHPPTISIWKFLLNMASLAYVDQLPDTVRRGMRVSDLGIANEGCVNYIRCVANRGTMGTTGIREVFSSWGVRDWHRVKPTLRYWIPRLTHWTLVPNSYATLSDEIRATWFVDPPYHNAAGSLYVQNDIDYDHLARWCRSRYGQVIVCENEGAIWLPFSCKTRRRGCFSSKPSRAKASGGEVVWEQER